MEKKIEFLKLQSSLSIHHVQSSLGGEVMEEITPSMALRYKDAIIECVMARMQDLVIYMDKSIYPSKVLAVRPNVDEIDGALYGVTEIVVDESLTEAELDQVISFITDQYRDGWGEYFSNYPIKVDGGTLYVSFWQPISWRYQMMK